MLRPSLKFSPERQTEPKRIRFTRDKILGEEAIAQGLPVSWGEITRPRSEARLRRSNIW